MLFVCDADASSKLYFERDISPLIIALLCELGARFWVCNVLLSQANKSLSGGSEVNLKTYDSNKSGL